MSYTSHLEAEFGLRSPASGRHAATGRIKVRHMESAEANLEVERFDPQPPKRGTILLTHFSFGSAALTPAHLDLIKKLASTLAARMATIDPLCRLGVSLEGHEDEVGDPAHFGALGRQRADAVEKALRPHLQAAIAGLPPGNRRNVVVLISTAGPIRPVRSNVTEDGRAMNRRVEIRASALCPKMTSI